MPPSPKPCSWFKKISQSTVTKTGRYFLKKTQGQTHHLHTSQLHQMSLASASNTTSVWCQAETENSLLPSRGYPDLQLRMGALNFFNLQECILIKMPFGLLPNCKRKKKLNQNTINKITTAQRICFKNNNNEPLFISTKVNQSQDKNILSIYQRQNCYVLAILTYLPTYISLH